MGDTPGRHNLLDRKEVSDMPAPSTYTVELLKKVLDKVPGNYTIYVREPVGGTFESIPLHLVAVTDADEVLFLSDTFA
jgi:hypothetical protein